MSNLKSDTSLLSLNLRVFALGMVVLVILSGISLFFIHQYYLDKAAQRHFEKQSLLLDERIDKKVKILHAATLILANNTIIREAMAYEDRDMLIAEMSGLTQQFAYWTGFENYAFHVISHDGRSVYRNYDPDNFGQDTTQHPLMTQAMADITRAFNLIGKGGYGEVYRIINTQPVFALDDTTQLVGFMTVSQGLKQLVLEFEQDQLDYYIFEREQDASGNQNGRFVVDAAPYFAHRAFSDWTFTEADLSHQSLRKRADWYYQTRPIYAEQQLRAFHLIVTPAQQINHQAWLQTERVLWILLSVLILLLVSGWVQLLLLKRNVLKPMQRLTNTLQTILKTERYGQVVTVTRQDEIGRVTDLFNDMLQRTDKLIFDLNYQKLAIDKTLIISRADKYGTITEVNDNFCKISGYRRDELIGQPHRVVRHPEMDSAVFKEMWQTIQAKQVWQGEVQNRRKDGSSYYVMSYIIPILNRQDEIQEYLSIREDITLIVELRDGLQKALAQAESDKLRAEQANKAKSEFLASMSHELRTPLNAIIGYAQLLELANLEAKSHKQVNIIYASSKHLLALITDILDYAKLEGGKVSFHFETLDVKEQVVSAVDLTQTQAKQHGIAFELSPITDKVFIQVDRLRFRQILINFLSNAIKYNKPHGKVWIRCQKIRRDQHNYWQFSIQDTGLGIAKQDLKNLFQPFNRLGHENSTIQGTGIGLSITKDLVEQMHGWIEVESEKGVGTTFKVFFPIVDVASSTVTDAPCIEQAVPQPPDILNHLKLLYIGHDPKAMQSLVQATQDSQNIELKIAPNAQNGLVQIDEFNPGLVMIDSSLAEQQDITNKLVQQDIQHLMLSPNEHNRLPELIQAYLTQNKQ